MHDYRKPANDAPDWLRAMVSQDIGGSGDMGFPKPHPSLTITPALRRQMDLCTNYRDVDYFLFDVLDRPVPFFVNNRFERAAFRIMRGGAIAEPDGPGPEVSAMAEYIIKHVSQRPGFNRELIVRQFEKEYGSDTRQKLREWEIKAQKQLPAGSTFIEHSAKDMARDISKFLDGGMDLGL